MLFAMKTQTAGYLVIFGVFLILLGVIGYVERTRRKRLPL